MLRVAIRWQLGADRELSKWKAGYRTTVAKGMRITGQCQKHKEIAQNPTLLLPGRFAMKTL